MTLADLNRVFSTKIRKYVSELVPIEQHELARKSHGCLCGMCGPCIAYRSIRIRSRHTKADRMVLNHYLS